MPTIAAPGAAGGVLESTAAIPVAVGSGTINDLTKLAAHRVNRPYMVVATAASMDGYTAYGASITASGSKQTFDCPAPRAVLADLEVIASAPPGMNASGYADLLAKIAAGRRLDRGRRARRRADRRRRLGHRAEAAARWVEFAWRRSPAASRPPCAAW